MREEAVRTFGRLGGGKGEREGGEREMVLCAFREFSEICNECHFPEEWRTALQSRNLGDGYGLLLSFATLVTGIRWDY